MHDIHFLQQREAYLGSGVRPAGSKDEAGLGWGPLLSAHSTLLSLKCSCPLLRLSSLPRDVRMSLHVHVPY